MAKYIKTEQGYKTKEELAIQPDWNQNDPNAPDYVKNRPFYDNRDKIEYTFDGNLEGKETFNAGPVVFVKVSSSTPDIPSIQEIEATFVPVGEDGEVFEEETISISDFGQVAEDIFSTQDMAFAIVLKDTIFKGITITKGVYLSKGDNGSYISRVFFKFDTGELKKLDKKYLPDGIGSLIITTYPYDQKILHSPHGLYEILRESWIKRMAVDIKVYSYNDYNSDTGYFVPHKIDSYQYDAAEDRFEIYFNNIQNAIYVNADGTVEYIILG